MIPSSSLAHMRQAIVRLNMPLLALALFSTLCIYGCQKPTQNPQAMGGFSIPVTYLTLTPHPIEMSDGYLAQVTSDASTWVKSQVEGRIQKVLVQDGTYVKAGTPLFVLDQTEIQATRQAAHAAVEATHHEVMNAQKAQQAIHADQQALEADLQYQTRQLERYTTLHATDTISQQQLEQTQSTVAQLQEKSHALTAQYQAQQARVQQIQSTVKQLQAQAQALDARANWYTIKAPFSGMMGEIKAKLGDVVATDTPLAELAQTGQSVEVEVRLPAGVLSKVHVGTPLYFTHLEGTMAGQGIVNFKAPRLDPETQTVLVKARVPQGSLSIDEKLYARLSWGKANTLMIPAPAVVRMTGATFVYKVHRAKEGGTSPDQAHLQPVMLGPMLEGAYPVIKGAKAGDVIITAGIQKLQGSGPVMDASKLPTQASANPTQGKGH
ncbi:MAG: efflux RND transporter periplasmic adaptor subunit [Vampirovibrionales bacterium]